MIEPNQRVEIAVGIFVLGGLALLGWLVYQFGDFDRPAKGGYELTVEVEDASGIRAGVPVRFGGVPVGKVIGEPEVSERFTTLEIPLRIDRGRRIPRGSEVRVGTSGLMGDSFIRILPPAAPPGGFHEPGDTVAAADGASLDEVAASAEETLTKANTSLERLGETLSHLDGVTQRMESEVMSDRNVENLSTLLEELSASSERLAGASGRLDPLLERAGEAATGVKAAASSAEAAFDGIDRGMEDFSGTLATIDPAVKELDGSLEDLRTTLRSVDGLLYQIEHGDGLAGALLSDEELRADLTDFVDKLDRRGVLFYPREGGLLQRNPEPASSGGRARAARGSVEEDRGEEEKRKRKPFSWLKRLGKSNRDEGRGQ